MLQPNIAQKSIVAALVQEQLSAMLQAGIGFPVLVKVGCVVPATVPVVEE